MAANPDILNKLKQYFTDKGTTPPTGGDKDKGKGEKPPERIPLPDYNDPASRLKYAGQFVGAYHLPAGVGYGDIPLRLNEKPQWGSDTSKNLALKEGKRLGLDPALLYSSSMVEGQSGLYPQKDKKTGEMRVHTSGNKDYPVSGAWSFGLDSFEDYLPILKKKGYLPQDFDKSFIMGTDANFEDPKNNQGVLFKTADAGVQAKAAMMRAYYDEMDDYAKKKGVKLNPEQRDYFALAHFNSGAHGYEILDAYNKAGALKNNDFINKMPNVAIPFMYKGKQMSPEASLKLHKQIYGNVVPRLHAAAGLKGEGYFDAQAQPVAGQQSGAQAAPIVRQKPIPEGAKVIETSEGKGYFDPHNGNFVKL